MSFIYAIISGAAMSIQGVTNARLGDKTGLFEANAFIQGTAFMLSVIIMLIWGKGDIRAIMSAKPYTWFGGAIGVIITVTVMLAVKNLNPQLAISVILVSQLAVATIIDTFGIMDTPKTPLTFTKIAGLCFMVVGVILLKMKK